MVEFTSALALAAAIKARQVSPVEVVRHYLARVDRLNPRINALIWRRDEELLREARAAEAAVMAGAPLPVFHGVPIPIKDLTEVSGEPVTMGSAAATAKVGQRDSTAVACLRRAGFLFMGRTNSPELGILPVTENALYGATRNPYNLAVTAGGSSGGAAAAVASGMAPIAHASDGGGSIRIPASYCGLVGLKASRGRIPKGPILSDIMHGFSTDGVVSRTVGDTAAALDAYAHRDPKGWWGVDPPAVSYTESLRSPCAPLRIGVAAAGPLGIAPAASGLEALAAAAAHLRGLGHTVVEARMDWGVDPRQLGRDFMAVWCTSTAYADISDWDRAEPLSQALRGWAMRQSSHDYVRAVIRLQVFSRRVVAGWGGDFDLLMLPTTAMEAPGIGWMFESGATGAEELLWRATEMVPNNGWCNVTGQPAISLPVHWNSRGMPVGVQLVAAPFREDQLLAVGSGLEAATGWVARQDALMASLAAG